MWCGCVTLCLGRFSLSGLTSFGFTSTALNYYTALKFTSNSSFTAAQRPKRILAILEGIFYGRAAADEIFSDSRSAFLLPIGQHSGIFAGNPFNGSE